MEDDDKILEEGWKSVQTNKWKREGPNIECGKLKQKTLTSYRLGESSQNRFAALQNDEIDEQINKYVNTEKISKPPHIFVHQVNNIQLLIQLLNEKVPKQYELKIIKANDVKIQPLTDEAYSSIVKDLEEKQTQFFTFKPKNEWSFRTILKNMHHSVDVEELKGELRELGYNVNYIFNMKHRETKLPLPMFVIEFEQHTNNKDIYDIKMLLHSRIVFEPPCPNSTMCYVPKIRPYKIFLPP